MDNIYNVLLWGTGIVFQRNIQLIKFLESQSMISVVAITSNDKSFSYIINGRPLKSINQFYNKRLAELKS